MKRNKLFQVLLLTGAILLTGCGESSSPVEPTTPTPTTPEVAKPTAISIEATADKLEVGKTLQLTAKVTPEGADASVTWSSSSDKIATVDANGLVKGVAVGDVIIKATSKVDAGVYKEIALTIEAEKVPAAEKIEITAEGGKKEVATAGSLQLTAKVTPAKADQAVAWKSSDNGTAIVNANGLVKGVKEGEVTITATSKKTPTVHAEIKLTVVKGEAPAPTTDWSKVEFSNHEAYMTAEKGVALKVKGTVTYLTETTDKEANPIYDYFLQNGKEGFYVRGQAVAVGEIKVGNSYEIGGFKEWHSGCNSLKAVEYVKPIEEKLPVEVVDITKEASYKYDDQKVHMGAKVTVNEMMISSLPSDVTSSKGFTIKLEHGDKHLDVRVNAGDVTPEVYKAIGDKVNTLLPHQVVSVTGAMTSFGYGKPGAQIALFSADDIVAKPLTDEAKVDLAVAAVTTPHTLDTEAKIELPKALENVEGVTMAWESSNAAVINAETGVVTHGERDVDVKLTMTATAGDKTAKKEYIVTVLSASDDYYTEVASLDFEDALDGNKYGCSASKSGYKDGDVELGGHKWNMNNALIGSAEDDRRVGKWGARMQTSGDLNAITLLDNTLKFDTVEALVGTYGKNALGTVIEVSYALDDATEFTVLPRQFVINQYELGKIRVALPVEGDHTVRVRLSAVKGTGQRVNIDNIRLLKTTK